MNTFNSGQPLRLGMVLLALIGVVGCGQEISNEDKLRLTLEAAPPLAPLAHEDISDPQIGYYHQTIGITGGNYIHVKAGDSRLKQPKTFQNLKFVPINFYDDEQPELVTGFKPTLAFCSFGKKDKDKWVCLIFRSDEDAKSYVMNNSDVFPVPFVACIDCKPKPMIALSRLCPGIYSSFLDTSKNWDDPSLPGPKFNEEGGCSFDKPWWQTEEGIRLGLEKFGDQIR